MLQATSREQVRAITRDWRRAELKTALVPTMGNLHDGHLSLVDEARRRSDRVIASIYVNPAQFGQGEDFDNYPRTLDADRKRLEHAGCDLLFLPDDDTVYPFGLENQVRVLASPDLTADLEGRARPGHFDGVATVVARLFHLVEPGIAVFGEKDFQQLLIIRRMVADLGFDIRIVSVPTVREAGGLAMSSRNNYLKPEEKTAAGALYDVLRDAARKAGNGPDDLSGIEDDAADRLERQGFRVDYIAIRNSADLGQPGPNDRDLRILAAGVIGHTRLIDNVAVDLQATCRPRMGKSSEGALHRRRERMSGDGK